MDLSVAVAETARQLVAEGKGILAADESSPTIKKRFDSIDVESTEENRRDYRQLLFTTEGVEEFISGVILFDETIRQKSADGTPLPELLDRRGIIPGIKVDEGKIDLTNFPGEKITEGLDGLGERLEEYRTLGARFTKWRAVITIIGETIPSRACLEANAAALARFAALSQKAGLTPIVEPEVLMDGKHTIERCEEVTLAALDKTRAEMSGPPRKSRHHKPEVHWPEADSGLIFRSESMGRVLVLAEKVAPTSATVLILGESGTGKEVLARFIHRHSGREKAPFLAINCAALPPNLLESELFGHQKGAFTGADADKNGLFVEAGQGTLLLDEVGELPPELQAKLLRALQEREVRPVGGVKDIPVKARIIAATNHDLREMVAQNRFREDLYYRLAVFPMLVTPLRQRRQDILLLARHFLSRLIPDHPGFSPQAVRMMETYPWPGNVRELENWVEYAVVLAGNSRIMPDHLPQTGVPDGHQPAANLILNQPTCEELERRYIQLVLDQTGGNKTEAARILGLSISTLWRRLKDTEQTGS